MVIFHLLLPGAGMISSASEVSGGVPALPYPRCVDINLTLESASWKPMAVEDQRLNQYAYD